MLSRLLYSHWDEPLEASTFEAPFSDIVQRIGILHRSILRGLEMATTHPEGLPVTYWQDCLNLYITVPALVNVALNYKVCIEQGLPLHPSTYFEIKEKHRFQTTYPEATLQEAQAFFMQSIACARSLYALEPQSPEVLAQFQGAIPESVQDFIYTSKPDRYTWRASDPTKIRSLATDIQKAIQPALILGAAHGSIMSGLLLANLLEVPLYFIRFSLFKRQDQNPVIAPSDLAFLTPFREGPVLFFDEDIAKGTTLARFTDYLRPFFQTSYSAGVLCHRHSAFSPDFIGKVWD